MTATEERVDPVALEIIAHRLHNVTLQMGATLERVGGTVNTTQLHDYICAIYRANGDVLSAGENIGWQVVCAAFAVKNIIRRFPDQVYPDDVFLFNDPYLGAVHQSDVYIICPVHFDGELVAWTATFVHVMDIGALSPGGNSPNATEVFHEGLRVPGVKISERGVFRTDVFDAFTYMTRQPAMVALDLKCEIAANHLARVQLHQMCLKYGTQFLGQVADALIRHTERVLRRRIAEIPDGCWRETAVIETQQTLRVNLELRKQGDRLCFDFTGTDPQASTGVNLPYHATHGTCFEAVLAHLGYDLPKNEGMLAPLEVIAPLGTLVNVKYPGPVSLNTTSGAALARFLAYSVMAQCLGTSPKWKQEAMAQTLLGRNARHAGVNRNGDYYASTLVEVRGSGATSLKDGVDSSGLTDLTCHNVEWAEQNYPILYLFRRHVKDGGGAGKFRGGAGLESAFVVHEAPLEQLMGVAFGVTGLDNSGRGLFGGYPGASSLLTLLHGTDVRRAIERGELPADRAAIGGSGPNLPYCEFTFGPGDALYMRTSSGGGYGDPLDREPDLVLQDLRNGMISAEVAEHVYGVVLIALDQVDLAATLECRQSMRHTRMAEAT